MHTQWKRFWTAIGIGGLGLVGAASWADVTVTDEVDVRNDMLEVGMDPAEGGTLHTFSLLSTPGNMAGDTGLLLEGFGSGSFYAPNRRVNERLETLEAYQDRPAFRYVYDCEGTNIDGFHVERVMELIPEAASMRVTWRVSNQGKERHWLAPWVRLPLLPGGSEDAQDRFDLPSTGGIVQVDRSAYYPMARNWVAATDTAQKETFYAVFHADQLHSVRTLWDEEDGERGYQAAFVPRLIEPGGLWETTYTLNAVRGLQHVDFAGGDLAAQIDYQQGKLTVLLSGVRAFSNVQIHARVLAKDGQSWALPAKQFSLTPLRLARCTYEWTAPANGAYDFIAELRAGATALPLGIETGSPHGGIDTQFIAGSAAETPFAPWTDAPDALNRGARTLRRTLAAAGTLPIWFENSLEKVFHDDRVEAVGSVNPVMRIGLAGNERESFQLVFRAAQAIERVSVRCSELTGPGGAVIPAEDVACHLVEYHPVRVPSYFEGPTGKWPDALPAYAPFPLSADRTQPIWFTVYARPDLPPGLYRGRIEIYASGLDPIELGVEAQVYGFSLPSRPALKTDFGFWSQSALEGRRFASAATGSAGADRLMQAYVDDASAHRVTLREAAAFPRESADYDAALAAYGQRLFTDLQSASTLSVPASLLDTPDQLVRAQDFMRAQNLSDRAFVHLADEPEEPAWPRLLETLQHWKDTAPAIPVLVTTQGLRPFLPEAVDIWGVHLPVFDTEANKDLLQAISSGHEAWCYVDHSPGRPYGNFFLDFAAIDHRILFWQCWALGARGMHYWCVNYSPEGQNPYQDVLDVTPVNGDGLLVYPGAEGPVDSIRWETIRDGIEDYDYLALLMDRRRKLHAQGGQEALLDQAAKAYNLEKVLSSLTEFTRDPAVLLDKRREIAHMIEEMDRALRSGGSGR